MNTVLTVPAELCIDNRRTERKRSAGQKNLRRTSLDSAALLARHYCPSRRPAAVAENAADGQVSDTARRPPGTPRTPEHRGSSGLRSLDVEDLGVVEEAVEDRGGEHFVAEELGPLGGRLVRGDDRRAARVAALDDLEEAVGVLAPERQKAGLVEDQELRALQLGELRGQLAERVRLPEPSDQVVERRVANEVAAPQRLHPEPHRQVALADAGGPEDQERDAPLDEAQRPEFTQAFGVELGLEGGVEFVERLVVGQRRELQPGGVA